MSESVSVFIMPQCKAFGCFNEKGKVDKSFYQFPDPLKSAEKKKLCQTWLNNLKNGSLPRKVADYTWKGGHLVCSDHFTADCFVGVYDSSVAASLGYKGKSRLRNDAVPTIIDVSSVDTKTGYAVRKTNKTQTDSDSEFTSGSTSSRQSRYHKWENQRLIQKVRHKRSFSNSVFGRPNGLGY